MPLHCARRWAWTGEPAHLYVKIVHAVHEKHGRSLLAALPPGEFETAEENVVARARHVVSVVARHDRVATQRQNEELALGQETRQMKTTTMIIVPKEACAVADNNFKKCAPACRANLGDLCPQKLVVFFFRCMFENHEKQKKN